MPSNVDNLKNRQWGVSKFPRASRAISPRPACAESPPAYSGAIAAIRNRASIATRAAAVVLPVRVREARQLVFALLTLSVAMHGCAGIPFENEDGHVTYLILGIGAVSVPVPSHAPDVVVVRSRSFGAIATNQPALKFALGYSSELTTMVAKDSDGVAVSAGGSCEPIEIRLSAECAAADK